MTCVPGLRLLRIHACCPFRAITSTRVNFARLSSARYKPYRDPMGNSAPTGTINASSAVCTGIFTSTRKRSPKLIQSSVGEVISRITLTRCSSTPSADTFVNAEGSTSRTRASYSREPPQWLSRAIMPGWTSVASSVSNSTRTSNWDGLAISNKGVPMVTIVSLD